MGATASPVEEQALTKHFIHITDIHYDPLYLTNTDPETQCHRAQRSGASSSWSLPETALIGAVTNKLDVDSGSIGPVTHYGARGTGCDSPLSLVEGTFEFIRGMLSRNRPLDFVLWTGDSSRHDRDSEVPRAPSEARTQNAQAIYYFQRTFDLTRTLVVPSIGNWDVFPHNTLEAPPNQQLEQLWSIWSPLFDTDAQRDTIKRDFLEGGWHARTLVEGQLKALSLNTMYWFDSNDKVSDCSPFSNHGLPSNSTNPGDTHLTWLQNYLDNLRSAGQKAILVGHIPPADHDGHRLYSTHCYKWFIHISGEANDVILTQYYGHVNKDVINVVVKDSEPRAGHGTKETPYRLVPVSTSGLKELDMDSVRVVGTIKTSASVVPVHNPGFRAGTMRFGRAATLTKESQYFLNLNRANQKYQEDPAGHKLQYHLACQTDVDYKMEDLSSASYEKFIRRLQRDLLPSSSRNKKHSMLDTYNYCVDANENHPRTGMPDDHLRLSNGVVQAVLITACILFFALLGGFWWFVRQQEGDSEWERQRLLFQDVEPERIRWVRWASRRERERGVDAHGVTI
ncbi:Endopolyphosphatase [Gaertneriomyces sp. JEL0708]|nr:Endopolyphosphatase [Gaertneriomyces sp. JEL0708]